MAVDSLRSEKIWMDGDLIPYDQANVHVLTHSLHYGLAVFEGLRAYNSTGGPAIFRLKEHTERFLNSAHIFMMRIPYDKEGRRHVETLQESNAQARCYRYTIDSSPMPIRNHTAELSVDDNRDGTSTVRWSADFDVEGPDPAKTVATIEQFMGAGLDSLKQRHAT